MLSDRCLSVLSVCNVGVLWPSGWMDQDETWHAGRPRPWPHCVRRGPSTPARKGHSAPSFWPMSIVAAVAHLSCCWALVSDVWQLNFVQCSRGRDRLIIISMQCCLHGLQGREILSSCLFLSSQKHANNFFSSFKTLERAVFTLGFSLYSVAKVHSFSFAFYTAEAS